MQFPSRGPQPIGIVFDSDLGDGVDGALALALVYGLEGKNEARLISTSTTKSSLKSAAFGDALARFFAGPPPAAGSFGGGFQRPAPPMGMADNGKLAADTPVLNAVLDKKTDDGKPVYPNGIVKLNDTADPVALIRNAMTAQVDQNCIVLLAGPATNLVKVMDLAGTLELIQRKVKLLIVAAGSYPEGTAADPRVKADVPAARRLFAEWPTPIVAVGTEVGEALPFPGASIGKDFAWVPAHPIVDAYRAFRPMPYDAAAPSMAAALYAAHPDSFKLSTVGAIAVLDDGRTRFTPKADGHSRYLTVDPDQKDKVIASYVELASAKPAPRQGGRGRPNQNIQKQDVPPPKPPEPNNQ